MKLISNYKMLRLRNKSSTFYFQFLKLMPII